MDNYRKASLLNIACRLFIPHNLCKQSNLDQRTTPEQLGTRIQLIDIDINIFVVNLGFYKKNNGGNL